MASPFESPTSNPMSTFHEDAPGVRRDGWGRYLLPHPSGPYEEDRPWTRATTFAKSISDTYALSMWSQRMAIKGVALRSDLYARVSATKLDDREELNKLAEAAKEAAGSKTAAGLGTALHAFSEAADRGESVVIPDPWDKDITAYQAALRSEGITILPQYIERVIVCQKYSLAGTFDRIVRMPDGTLRIADLKTGRDLSYGWPEIAIQLAVYANADAIWVADTNDYEPMPEVDRQVGLVMHLPVGQRRCDLYDVNIGSGWEAADLCHQVRAWRKTRNLARMRTSAVTDGTVLVRGPSITDRIAKATSVGELSAIWDEYATSPEWTMAHARAARERRDTIESETKGG